MKKTIILSIAAVLTIGCIIYGTNRHTNHSIGFFKSDIEKENSINENLNKFDSIDLSGSVMGVEIVQGKEYRFLADYNHESLKPEFKINNGKLTITQDAIKISHGNNNCKLKITVPENALLKNISITLNVGDVRLENLDCTGVTVKTNVGQINILDTKFDDANIKSNVGEVKIVPVDKISEYKIDAETNVGQIIVDGQLYKKQFSQKNNTGKSISAKTNVGEIKIK